MNKPPVISAKDFHSLLLKYGCRPITSEGSHFKVEYPKTGKRTMIPIHGNKGIKIGFMKTILRQLSIDVDDFLKFIM